MARRQQSNPLISDHLRNFDRTHPAYRFLGQYIGFLNNVAHEPRLVFIDETMHDPQHAPSTDRRFYAILNTGVYNREIRDFEAQHSLPRGQRENFLTATHESITNQSRHHRVPPQHAKDLSHGSTPVPTHTSAEVLKNLKAQAQKTHEAAKQKPAPQPQTNHQKNMTPPDTPTHQPGRGPRLT